MWRFSNSLSLSDIWWWFHYSSRHSILKKKSRILMQSWRHMNRVKSQCWRSAKSFLSSLKRRRRLRDWIAQNIWSIYWVWTRLSYLLSFRCLRLWRFIFKFFVKSLSLCLMNFNVTMKQNNAHLLCDAEFSHLLSTNFVLFMTISTFNALFLINTFIVENSSCAF